MTRPALPRTCWSGFCDANARYVVACPGGVVRAHKTRPGKVAVVLGGGSGHYPAFCGTVGPGFADGAVVGNIFTSPSAEEAASVARAAHSDAGVLLTTGNYAGDVMNFGLAVTQLRSEGIEAHYCRGHRRHRQRARQAKTPSAAASPGISRYSNVRVRQPRRAWTSPGWCGWPRRPTPRPAPSAWPSTGARCRAPTIRCSPCPRARWVWGWASTASPGVADEAMPTADELAATLVDGVLADKPDDAGRQRIAVILNGLGRTKYEELFVVWGTVARLLRETRLHRRRTRGG